MIALEPGQQWLSQFRLLKELAAAADRRPSVWLAEKPAANGKTSRVVLKFLPAGPSSPFLVRRLADWRATHIPHFMPLLGVHTAGEQIALELPYLPEDNAALRGKPYPQWSVWLEQVAEALQELHAENFVHGDLKLGNLRRDAAGRPVLSDPWLPGDGRSPYTSSPERLNGGPISVQDDLYALGALMHELATGYPPGYPGLAGERAGLARTELPDQARELMQALLSVNPMRRPSLNEVIDRLVPLNATPAQPFVPAAAARPSIQPKVWAARTTAVDDAPRTVILTAPAAPRPTPRVAPPLVAVPSPLPHEPTIILRTSPPPPLLATDTPFEPVPLAVEAPAWKQPAGPGVNSGSPFQSRASVWRWPLLLILLGAAIAAFVWLPEEMRQSAVEQVAAVAARAGLVQSPSAASIAPHSAAAPAALKDLAEQKLAAEQVRDQAQSLQTNLREHGAEARAMPVFVSASEALKQGLAAFERRDFGVARTDFTAAVQGLQATQQMLPELHKRALADGDAALAQCLPAQALNEYRYALALMPEDAAAKVGIERAQVCEQVFARVSAGDKAGLGGDVVAARREYQAALQLDPRSSTAHDALAKLDGEVDDTQFSRELAAALEGLRTQHYSAAATALAATDRLRPNSADVQRLKLQLGEVQATERLHALKAEATEDEHGEHWQEALDAYRAMLGLDGTLALGVEGARRSQERVQLDAELTGYLDHPDRLSAGEVREAAAAALLRARAVQQRGPRLEAQISQLAALQAQYDSTVQVALRSDGITDITIYRVGALGRFTQRAVSLRPGRYTIVGSRLGYHDVRRDLEIVPGEKNVVFEIRCEEQI